jgi:branched-chain amino acid transport system substrate-binding protein
MPQTKVMKMSSAFFWCRRTAVAVAAAAVLTQAFPVPAQAQATAEPIKFGFFGPLTGRFGANGTKFKEAIDLFVEQTNAAGGLAGRKLVVTQDDDRGEPLQSTAIAQKLAADESVVAAIGSFTSGASIAAGSVFAAAKMPQVSPSSSHPDFTKISSYQFRIPNTQDTMSLMYAKMMKDNLPTKRVAVIYYQDDWGIYVGKATKAALEAGGSEVPIYESMLPDARDFRPFITKMRQAKVDSIFLASHYGPSAIFLQQLRQAGLEQPVGGPETLYSPELITLAGKAADDIITTTYFFPGDPTKAAFVEAYRKKYDHDPDLWAAYAWDAVAIAAEGARTLVQAGKPVTRQSLRDAIADLPPFSGLTGVTKFVDGTPNKELTLLEIKDGAYKLYRR